MRYIFKITGDADGRDDLIIPVSQARYKQKNGSPSSLYITIPGISPASELSYRPNGDIVMASYDGETETEIVAVPIQRITPNEGSRNKSIALIGERQTTWTVPDEPVPLQNVFFRAPNQGDGKYTYHVAGYADYVRAGYPASESGNEFVIGGIQYNLSKDGVTSYISEA